MVKNHSPSTGYFSARHIPKNIRLRSLPHPGRGKSSLARIGLMIHNYGRNLNPGLFSTSPEITNQNNVPIIIRPAMEIARSLFPSSPRLRSLNYKKSRPLRQRNWKHFIPAKVNGKKKIAAQVNLWNSIPNQQYLDLLKKALGGEEQSIKARSKNIQRVWRADALLISPKAFAPDYQARLLGKGVLHELYWFMSGQSQYQIPVDNDVHIWTTIPTKIYNEKVERKASQQ